MLQGALGDHDIVMSSPMPSMRVATGVALRASSSESASMWLRLIEPH
jgi:hypothetical protein